MIIVTGCAGFIGSKTAELLLSQGELVLGIDDLNESYDAALKRWRLQRLLEDDQFSFCHADISDLEVLQRQLDGVSTEITAVAHLAARAGVRQSVENPWIYYQTNVTGTLNLLELCRSRGVGKFLLASTSSLYGAHNPRPFREDAKTDMPLSPYAASKKAAESLCYTYHYLYGMDISIPRFFTVYGPAGRPDMSIFRFIKRIAERLPITVFGDGFQERDFTYVNDIAKGVVLALKPLGFETLNLGSDRPYPLHQVIGMIEEFLGSKAITEYRAAHAADVQTTWANISKAHDLLGWRPETSLEEGLRRSIAWYHENREWARNVRD